MKRRLLVCLLAAAIPAAASAGTFLCLGDSLTEGENGGSGDGYLGPLASFLTGVGDPATMINSGVGGDTTDRLRDRLATALSAYPGADTVLLMIGTNDVTGWVVQPNQNDRATTRNNLAAIVDDIRNTGRRIVLATVPPRVGSAADPDNSLTRELNSDIRSIASQSGVTLAEVFDQLLPFANPIVYDDDLHLEFGNYSLISEAFGAAITAMPIGSIDLTGPLPIDADPSPDERDAELDTALDIVVRDSNVVDVATAVLMVDGEVVVPDVSNPRLDEASFHYAFPEPLRFGQNVKVELRVADMNVTPGPNQTVFAYRFGTSDGNGTAGDVDGSGRIDGRDIAIVAGAFGSRIGDSLYRFNADIDANGRVNGVDLAIVSAGFGGAP